LNANQHASHFYDIVLTHKSEDPVGRLENSHVGRSDVVVDDELKRNHPTLFADLVVSREVAKAIDAGKWPRRSCVANLRAKTLKNCALLAADDVLVWPGGPTPKLLLK